MPIDTIERAIKRGTGELDGVTYEPVTYEGYAPCGVAVIVECLTDNRNRTGPTSAASSRKNGGSMAEPGAVAWQFERKGVVILPKTVAEDDLMLVALEAGAEDLADQGDTWQLTSAPQDLHQLTTALEEAGIAFDSADLTMLPTTAVPLETEGDARKVLRLIDALEEHDDVQNVYANFDIPDATRSAARPSSMRPRSVMPKMRAGCPVSRHTACSHVSVPCPASSARAGASRSRRRTAGWRGPRRRTGRARRGRPGGAGPPLPRRRWPARSGSALVLVEGEVEGGVERVDSPLGGDVGKGARHQGAVELGLGDRGLVPLGGEDAAGAGAGAFPPGGVGVHVGPSLAGHGQHLFEGVERREGERVRT